MYLKTHAAETGHGSEKYLFVYKSASPHRVCDEERHFQMLFQNYFSEVYQGDTFSHFNQLLFIRISINKKADTRFVIHPDNRA